jgi:hypothetical protein
MALSRPARDAIIAVSVLAALAALFVFIGSSNWRRSRIMARGYS